LRLLRSAAAFPPTRCQEFAETRQKQSLAGLSHERRYETNGQPYRKTNPSGRVTHNLQNFIHEFCITSTYIQA
jgi:hypothetical protein